jgi:DNA-binding NarL/FixJ family response regulator
MNGPSQTEVVHGSRIIAERSTALVGSRAADARWNGRRYRRVARLDLSASVERRFHAADLLKWAIAGCVANFSNRHADIVLLDISLASGSGFDVLRAVPPRAPNTVFYMLSSYSAYPYRQLAEKLGARGFFDKTHEFERVREVVAHPQ